MLLPLGKSGMVICCGAAYCWQRRDVIFRRLPLASHSLMETVDAARENCVSSRMDRNSDGWLARLAFYDIYEEPWYSRIDVPNSGARESSVHSSKRRETFRGEGADDQSVIKCRETCRGGANCPEIDFRVQGLPYSTVEQQDTTRKDVVKELIHQIETHPNREALKADLHQNQAYNPFSEKSKDMIHSLGNVEYFEMCEISAKIQCPFCLTYCTKGIVCCRCVFSLHTTDKTRELNSDGFDILSIQNYVIQQSLVRIRRCGNTDAQHMYHEAHESLKRHAKKDFNIFMARFQSSEDCGESQAVIGWAEEQSTNLDRITAEDHRYTATSEERARLANTGKLSLNSSERTIQ